MNLSRRHLLALTAATGLSGCGAVGAVSRASAPLDTYTLTPLGPLATRAPGNGHLVVELPTAGGALASDRILMQVTPLQAEYLPDARWSEPTPALLQTLLLNAFVNRGGVRLVSRVGAGLMPDHTLMTEIQAFQAELSGAAPAAAQVRILLRLTLIREADRRIAGARSFGTTIAAAGDSTPALVAALDNAMQTVLAEAVIWVQGLT